MAKTTVLRTLEWCFALLVALSMTPVASATVQLIAWNAEPLRGAGPSSQLPADQERQSDDAAGAAGKFAGTSAGSSSPKGGGDGSAGGASGSADPTSSSEMGEDVSPSTSGGSPINHEQTNAGPPDGGDNVADNNGGGAVSSHASPSESGAGGLDLFDGIPDSPRDLVDDVFQGVETPPESVMPTSADLPGIPAGNAPVEFVDTPASADFASTASAPEPGTLLTVGLCLLLGFATSRHRYAPA